MKKRIFAIIVIMALMLSVAFIAGGCCDEDAEEPVSHAVSWTLIAPDGEYSIPVTARVNGQLIASGALVEEGSNVEFTLGLNNASGARVYRVEVWRGDTRLPTQFGTALFAINQSAAWTLANVEAANDLEFRVTAPEDVETWELEYAQAYMWNQGWGPNGTTRPYLSFVLLDVRFAEEYSTARLYGTRHIHYSQLIDNEALIMSWIAEMFEGQGKDTLIILY